MNRSTLLAALLLVIAAATLLPTTNFGVDLQPAALALPEQLAPRGAEPMGNALIARVLLTATALFLLLWRRGVGQGPILALLPALAVLFHPAMYAVGATPSAWLELGCFALAALAAWFLTFERSALAVVGAVLGFVAVLLAPSGAPLAAFVAFALAEAEPGLPGASVFAGIYGLARALGLATPLELIPSLAPYTTPLVSVAPHPPVAGATSALAEHFLRFGEWLGATAGALVPRNVPLVVAFDARPPQGVAVGLAICAGLLIAWLFLPAEKRFGGRSSAFFALASLAMLALIQMRTGLEDAVVLISSIALVATWLAATADQVNSHPLRRAVTLALSVLLVLGLGFARLTRAGAIESRSAFLRQLAPPAMAYPSDSLERAILFEQLPTLAESDVVALGKQAEATASTRRSPSSDRDLAVACALVDRPDLGIAIVQHALSTPHLEFDGDVTLRNRLRGLQLDLMLRARRSRDVIDWSDELLAHSEGVERSEWLVRKAAGHLQLAYGSEGASGDRDREVTAAVLALDAAVAADPNAARAYFDRGRLAMARGDGITAVKDLEKAAQLRPTAVEPLLQLATFYLSRQQESSALAAYERAKKLARPDDAEFTLFEARRAASDGDLARAQQTANALESRSSRLLGGAAAIGDLYALIATVAEEQKNDGLALVACRSAIRLRDDRSGALAAQLARILKRTLGYEELIAHLKDVKARKLTFPELDLELSLAYKNAGMGLLSNDRAKARERFLAAIAVSPAFDQLGTAPLLARNISDELKLPLDPVIEQSQRAYEFGVARRDSDAAAAARAFEVSRTLLPANAYALFQLALIRKAENDRSVAKDLLRQTVRIAKEIDALELAAAAEKELAALGSD